MMIYRRSLSMLLCCIALGMVVGKVSAQPSTQLGPGSWSGRWVGEGRSEGVLPATITINAIENRDGKLFAVGESQWGDYAPWNVKAGTLQFRNAAVNGNEFVIGDPSRHREVLICWLD